MVKNVNSHKIDFWLINQERVATKQFKFNPVRI